MKNVENEKKKNLDSDYITGGRHNNYDRNYNQLNSGTFPQASATYDNGRGMNRDGDGRFSKDKNNVNENIGHRG